LIRQKPEVAVRFSFIPQSRPDLRPKKHRFCERTRYPQLREQSLGTIGMRFLAKISFFGAFQGPNQGLSCKGFFYMKHRLVTTVLKAKQRTGVVAERMAK